MIISFLQKMDATEPVIPAVNKNQQGNRDKLMEQRRQNAERVRRHRAAKRQNEAEEKEFKKKAAEQKHKYQEARRQQEYAQDSFQRAQKCAERQRQYLETIRQNETQEESLKHKHHNVEKQTRHVKAKKQRYSQVFIARQALDCFDETTVNTQTVGGMSYICTKCKAYMFKAEKTKGSLMSDTPTATFSLCCF